MSAPYYQYPSSANACGNRDRGRKRNIRASLAVLAFLCCVRFLSARYDTRGKDPGPPPSCIPPNTHHHNHQQQQQQQRRPLSPVSVGDVCNRVSKVSFDTHPSVHTARPRNRSAEPRHLDKPHDSRPPSVNAVRSVVPDRCQQDQLPICSRPDAGGTKGQSVTLYTNHFKCNLPENLAIVSRTKRREIVDGHARVCV